MFIIRSMAALPQILLPEFKKFYYNRKLSARQVAQKYGVSMWSVYYFMRKNKLRRRTFSEEMQLRFSKKPLSFKLKKNINANERQLKTLGVILYWGEGYKSK